jgi:hypothetical protein
MALCKTANSARYVTCTYILLEALPSYLITSNPTQNHQFCILGLINVQPLHIGGQVDSAVIYQIVSISA